MWRKSLYRAGGRRRAFVYVCAIAAMMVYSIPRLPKLQPGVAGSFAMLWILFAGVALAANLYFLFGADKERSKMLSVKAQGLVVHDEEDEFERMKEQGLR